MATRPKGFGLTYDIQNKIAASYSPKLESEARVWLSEIADRPMAADPDVREFQELLKDGTFLCEVINKINPGSVKKINKMKMPFMQMENISNFLSGCEKYGVKKTDLFQTVDLYENQNMTAVVNTLHALGRACQKNGFNGPVLGPKEATESKREFSDEQLKQGASVIGLQMGTNKMASQAGMSFGGQRHINDIKVDEASKEGQAVIGLQYGSNKGASQSGQNFGKARHIVD